MEDGVWRTIGGRRVFIKEGQSLSDAMKESGKFKSKEQKPKKMTDEEKQKEIERLEKEIEKTSIFDPKRRDLRDRKYMLEENFEGTLEEYRAKKEKDKQERIKAREEK